MIACQSQTASRRRHVDLRRTASATCCTWLHRPAS
ncbi:putative leader peptide [Quadrisphaera sp. KR29]